MWLDTELAFLEFDSDMVQHWAAVAVVVMALAVLELLILENFKANDTIDIIGEKKQFHDHK